MRFNERSCCIHYTSEENKKMFAYFFLFCVDGTLVEHWMKQEHCIEFLSQSQFSNPSMSIPKLSEQHLMKDLIHSFTY